MVPLINQDQYTSPQYRPNIITNKFRNIYYKNNINNYLVISNIDKDVWKYGISPHFSYEYGIHISTILSNILNANQNSLSSLNVQYIGYFYLYYQKLIKIFPNLLYSNYLRFVYILNKYIHSSLIRFNSNINYLSNTFSTLSSDLSNIKCLVSFISDLPELIKKVLCNLKASIGLNMTLLSSILSPILKIFICCNKEIQEAIKIICCINKLINTKCNKVINDCSKSCLNQIKCKLRDLYLELYKLYCRYCYINCLKIQTQNIIKCNDEISTLKIKICELIKRYKCSISEFKSIESKITSAKSKIAELKELKQKLCKSIESGNTIILSCKISPYTKIVSITNINNSNGKKEKIKSLIEKLKCLTDKIEKIFTEFEKIDKNTRNLKHSLVFNSYYFQISSQILESLGCIDSQQKVLCQKSSDLKGVESGIKVISDNIRDVKSMIDKMNERRDDLAYIRDSLCSIIPKLCKIKNTSNKILELKSVVDPLKKIESSIEKLKDLEHDVKCLQIFECADKNILKQSLICISDNLDIKSITEKLETVRKYICSLESVICKIKNLLGYIETVENILSVIRYLKRNIDKLPSGKFIRCSIQSTTNNTKVTVLNDNRVILLHNQVYGLYSVMNVGDYEVVVNRLYDLSKKIDQIFQLIPWYDSCQCILRSLSFLNYLLLIIKV